MGVHRECIAADMWVFVRIALVRGFDSNSKIHSRGTSTGMSRHSTSDFEAVSGQQNKCSATCLAGHIAWALTTLLGRNLRATVPGLHLHCF